MFEPTGEDVPSTPSDHEWIVYSDPSERWNTALSSFPSNYEGERARSNIRTAQGNFSPGEIELYIYIFLLHDTATSLYNDRFKKKFQKISCL